MSNKPTWTNVGRATTAQYWTPSATSVRSTIAEHAVSNKNYSPPSHLRRPFGEVSLQSTSETDYRTANQHTSFLNRTTKLRNSMSASGLSFIRDIAEAIPLPSSDKPNYITRSHKRPPALNAIETYKQAANDMLTMASSSSSTLPMSTNDITVNKLREQERQEGTYLGISKTSSGVIGSGSNSSGGSSSLGYQQVGRPEHARRKVFIDAAFNASNFSSTGLGMQSGMGVLKAQSFYTDKNRPFGDGPKVFKGECHSVPKFTNFSTKQTMRRTFLSPTNGGMSTTYRAKRV